MDLQPIKKIPIIQLAQALDIQVRGTKAMCFNGHDKKTPSLTFYENTNSWKCFGSCDQGGDNIELVMKVLDIDFKSAIKWFESYGISIDSKTSYTKTPLKKTNRVQIKQENELLHKPDTELMEWFISRCGNVSEEIGLNYLKSHGINIKTANRYLVKELKNSETAKNALIKKWGLERALKSGLINKSERGSYYLIWFKYSILFPFIEEERITYIQGRLFGAKAKYINPKNFPKPLYNKDKLTSLKNGEVIHICEGIPDALALESYGHNATAVLGATSFKSEWSQLFKMLNVIISPDGDEGGKTFSKKVTKILNEHGISVRTLIVGENKDVSDVIAEMGKNNGNA